MWTGWEYLSNLQYFAEKGEFSSVPDTQGNVYVADGDVYVYGPDGKQIRRDLCSGAAFDSCFWWKRRENALHNRKVGFIQNYPVKTRMLKYNRSNDGISCTIF